MAAPAALLWVRGCTLVLAMMFGGALPRPVGGAELPPFSPAALVVSRDGTKLYVAGATASAVLVVDPRGAVLQRIEVPAAPSGLALSADETQLIVTCAAAQSTVCIVDLARAAVSARLPAGHTAVAPVLAPDGRTLFVSHRFADEVAVFDLAARKQIGRIAVTREPIAAAITPDGRLLFVANHLPLAGGYAQGAAAVVDVIDTATRQVRRSLRLPNGSGLLLGATVSPDGRYAAITHNVARFTLPTTQVERGWMSTAALTLIDVAQLEVINTVLLDNVELGAANPWAVAWTPDGRRLLVTHAGTHELSVIEFPALVEKLARLPAALAPGVTPDYTKAANTRADVPSDLAFLVGLRRRIRLGGNGPRALAVAGATAWVAGYFSDTLEAVALADLARPPVPLALGPAGPRSAARRGEMAFNDATICFQQWQSCANCHSYDARVDGLNWDLLNDGIGNPKNAKSLLWSHRTPPAMSTAVRDTAEVAVRAGVRHILFAEVPPEVTAAMDAYLKSLAPAPSPWLEAGRLSRAAQRGRALFESRAVGCAQCHPAGLFTDLHSYDVGTAGPGDPPAGAYDTPTLVELWRTSPYLHDGAARTIREVLTARNRGDRHGTTSHLTAAQIDDLAAYVLSL